MRAKSSSPPHHPAAICRHCVRNHFTGEDYDDDLHRPLVRSVRLACHNRRASATRRLLTVLR